MNQKIKFTLGVAALATLPLTLAASALAQDTEERGYEVGHVSEVSNEVEEWQVVKNVEEGVFGPYEVIETATSAPQ
ncbi:hypothetical protein G5C51_19750 [Streptomyces sp. A7024]|uniref:Secreted protein n=1 Tax=Streptomyces coryli TaxID=1128680 RepID=A0A6G4U1H7_9ACTN|nr:hypothetical protein [Streptomyces coryli]NGN66119.1 hypothetical protein [Streptomyces coryli]